MKVLTNNKYYSEIANVIREQNGTNNTYTPPQMVSALKDLFYEEVEGVPPITFQGVGENLLDYRIDGASGGVGDRTGNLAKWDTHLLPLANGIVVNDLNSISSIIDVTSINNIYLYGDRTKLNSNAYRIGKSNEPISLNSQTTRITYAGNILDTSDCNYVIVSCSIYNTGTTFDDIKNSFMIVEGSSEPSVFEPYGYKVPVVVNGKNLFDETQVPDKSTSTESSNYQIFKQNGKLIVNGITTSSQADIEISKENGVNNQALDFINNNAGNYIFTSSVPGRIMIRYKQNGSDVVRYTFDEYNSSNRVADRIVFRLQQNYQYNNEQMNIMFKLKQIQSDNYEAYHEPTTTNIYLDEPIEENESISLSDTNVNIPTIRGTNVLTVDTTVQPSNVYIKSRHESSYETAMRERYEEAQAQLEALESEEE